MIKSFALRMVIGEATPKMTKPAPTMKGGKRDLDTADNFGFADFDTHSFGGGLMGNIDAYFSAHEAAYERRYGPIFMGTLIEDMRRDPNGADYTRALRKRQKTGEHETAICEDCGEEFSRLKKADLKRRKCPKCHNRKAQ